MYVCARDIGLWLRTTFKCSYPASTPLPVPSEGAPSPERNTVPEIAGVAPSEELLSFLSPSQKMNCSQLSNNAGNP